MELEGIFEAEPYLSFTSGGKAICNFSVDGTRCVAWEELAENIDKHIRVGDKVKIFGYTKERWWTTPEGKKRSTKAFTVNRIKVLERPQPIKNCCYYCSHFNTNCASSCYNALGGLSHMETCEVEDNKCVERFLEGDNEECFEVRL